MKSMQNLNKAFRFFEVLHCVARNPFAKKKFFRTKWPDKIYFFYHWFFPGNDKTRPISVREKLEKFILTINFLR